MLKFPFIHRIEFEPVMQESDELLASIAEDPDRQDDQWQLKEEIDPVKLDRFWDETLRELKNTEIDS